MAAAAATADEDVGGADGHIGDCWPGAAKPILRGGRGPPGSGSPAAAAAAAAAKNGEKKMDVGTGDPERNPGTSPGVRLIPGIGDTNGELAGSCLLGEINDDGLMTSDSLLLVVC